MRFQKVTNMFVCCYNYVLDSHITSLFNTNVCYEHVMNKFTNGSQTSCEQLTNCSKQNFITFYECVINLSLTRFQKKFNKNFENFNFFSFQEYLLFILKIE